MSRAQLDGSGGVAQPALCVENDKRCTRCGAQRSAELKLKRCMGCMTVLYCSKQCQAEDWEGHKDLCHRLSEAASAASPASVSTAVKRQRAAAEENEDLQCLICFELVVDAVQVRCCGALHCRACISKCATCPMCRKPVNADTIMPDVRCERLSAAAIRKCLYVEEGCTFNGNRASVAAHEELCEYVPRSVLREKIQKLENDVREQSLAHMTERFRLTSENSAISERAKTEKQQMQQALVSCALGPQPAHAALRVLYELEANTEVYEIDREAAKGRSHAVYESNLWDNVKVVLHVHESHHNVAVWLIKKQPYRDTRMPKFSSCIMLLHPYDVTLAKYIFEEPTDLNGKHQVGVENFMTSKELDEYCVNGKYYIA
jgi:hypothetical protein